MTHDGAELTTAPRLLQKHAGTDEGSEHQPARFPQATKPTVPLSYTGGPALLTADGSFSHHLSPFAQEGQLDRSLYYT